MKQHGQLKFANRLSTLIERDKFLCYNSSCEAVELSQEKLKKMDDEMKEFFTKLTSQSKTVNAATQKTDNIKKNVGETSIAVIRLEKK